MAIQDDLTLQFIPILLDLIVFHHDNHHVHIVEELVEVVELVLHDILLQERIVTFQRTGQVTLLRFEQLQGR